LTAVATKGGLTTQDYASFALPTGLRCRQGLEKEILKATAAAKDHALRPVVKAGELHRDPIARHGGVVRPRGVRPPIRSDSLDENEADEGLLKIGTVYGTKDLNIFDSGVEGGNRGEVSTTTKASP
jgi:hypothetical protein